MAELKKILFKDFPDETTPVCAENLNIFQNNVEEKINEEVSAMNSNADTKLNEVNTRLQQFDTESTQKLEEIQTQANEVVQQKGSEFDAWFENIKGKLGDDVATNLQNSIDEITGRISNIEASLDKKVYIKEIEDETLDQYI